MLILGINGSSRKGGNTELLLSSALKGAKDAGAETIQINLRELKFSHCLSCDNAKNTGECIVMDEMQKIYPLIKNADGVIIASPIYFGSVSALTKMLVDRFQCHWAAIYMHKTLKQQGVRPGLFLCVQAAARDEYFVNARSIIKNLFGALNLKYAGELLCKGLETKGEIRRKEDCLEKSGQAGRDLVLNILKGGK